MAERIPYIGFGNDTLAKLPGVKSGDAITCPTCGDKHALEDSTPPSVLLFYKCGEHSYVGAVNGRLTIGVPADVKGEIDG